MIGCHGHACVAMPILRYKHGCRSTGRPMDKSSEAYLFLKRSSDLYMDRPFLMKLQADHIKDKAAGRPEFLEELRIAAIEALSDDDSLWIRRGLHALAVVGQRSDASLVLALEQHSDALVARDARTCRFELEGRQD